MTARLPTPGEVEEMRERHVETPGDEIQPWPYEWCQYDGQDWPCDAARLLALVDAQKGGADRLVQYQANTHARAEALSARLAAVLAECDAADKVRLERELGV